MEIESLIGNEIQQTDDVDDSCDGDDEDYDDDCNGYYNDNDDDYEVEADSIA